MLQSYTTQFVVYKDERPLAMRFILIVFSGFLFLLAFIRFDFIVALFLHSVAILRWFFELGDAFSLFWWLELVDDSFELVFNVGICADSSRSSKIHPHSCGDFFQLWQGMFLILCIPTIFVDCLRDHLAFFWNFELELLSILGNVITGMVWILGGSFCFLSFI